jgi:hypothetical protein
MPIRTRLARSARKTQHDGGRNTAPPLSVVAQPMQQLRTGTDNLPILSQVAQPGATAGAPAGPPQHSYEGLNTPSVWRSARSQAAAKVDALASEGMDESERARRDARGEAPIRTRSSCAIDRVESAVTRCQPACLRRRQPVCSPTRSRPVCDRKRRQAGRAQAPENRGPWHRPSVAAHVEDPPSEAG